MPNVNRDAIRAFLRQSGAPDDLADRAMVAAETLFAQADADRFALYDESSSTPERRVAFESLGYILNAIPRATGRPIRRMLRVSFEHPIPRQPWMTAEAYEQYREVQLDNVAREILEASVSPAFVEMIELAQSDVLEQALDAVSSERRFSLLWGTLDVAQERAAGLKDPPGFSWRHACLNKLSGLLRPMHEAAERRLGFDDAARMSRVFAYLFAFAIVGDEERVALFTELAEILAWVIPIGWKKDEPDTLLIRVA